MPIDSFVQMSSMDCHEIKGDNSLKDPHMSLASPSVLC